MKVSSLLRAMGTELESEDSPIPRESSSKRGQSARQLERVDAGNGATWHCDASDQRDRGTAAGSYSGLGERDE